MPELANVIFKLAVNERSDSVKSPLGFHVFLLNEIIKSQPIALAEVKDMIKTQLLQGRQDKVLQAKVSEIDDAILASNSLSEASQKFSLKINSNPVLINQTGKDNKGVEVSEIKSLEGFAANAFATAAPFKLAPAVGTEVGFNTPACKVLFQAVSPPNLRDHSKTTRICYKSWR